MANIELRKQILDNIINFTDRVTAFAQTLNVREIVTRISEVAMTATNVGMQLASGIASMAEGAGILPGAGAFMTLASCAVSGATTLGQAFLPSIINVLENGVVPNLGVTLRNRLVQRREALETGEQISISSGLGDYVAAALADLSLIGGSAMNGVASVDTDSLLGMTDQVASSVGTIMDSVQTYTSKLSTLKDEYMAGVGSDQLNTAVSSIYNTTNNGASKIQQLINKIGNLVGVRQDTDTTQAGRYPIVDQLKVGDKIVSTNGGGEFGVVKEFTEDGKYVIVVEPDGNEIHVGVNSPVWTGLKLSGATTNSNTKATTNTGTAKTNTVKTVAPVTSSGLSSGTLKTLQSNLQNKERFSSPSDTPIEDSVMVRYKSDGNIDNYFATVWKVDKANGTFSVLETVGQSSDGQDITEEKTYKMSDFTNSAYAFYYPRG